MKKHESDIFEERRRLLGGLGGLGVGACAGHLSAGAAERNTIELPFENGERTLTSAFPQKSDVILQRTRPPLIETPFEVFDQGVFTPNNRFYVRWHLADIPTAGDPATFRLDIRAHVNKTVRLRLTHRFSKFPRF